MYTELKKKKEAKKDGQVGRPRRAQADATSASRLWRGQYCLPCPPWSHSLHNDGGALTKVRNVVSNCEGQAQHVSSVVAVKEERGRQRQRGAIAGGSCRLLPSLSSRRVALALLQLPSPSLAWPASESELLL